jgi:pantoate--beta-alanine ligase
VTVPIARTLSDLRSVVRGWRDAGERVSVVPTMGALHEGHLSLVRAAKDQSERVIVTLFVNPTQFGNPDDLETYPRTEADDAKKLAPFEVDLLYAPDAGEIYPKGFATTVSVAGVSEGLCGDFRPGHFDAVATVVAKLLLQTAADVAFFGDKDYQQLHVIRRMARDLDIPVTIVACPTIREPDQLAISSRNVQLSPEDRKRAPVLAATLFEAAGRIEAGEPVAEVLQDGVAALKAAGFETMEYLELRAASDLRALDRLDEPARLLVATYLGTTRLIDNVEVGHGLDNR